MSYIAEESSAWPHLDDRRRGSIPRVHGTLRRHPQQLQSDRAFGDDEKAVLMYDTDTVPVKDAPGAERLTVWDGKTKYMRIVFDRLTFEAS
jgi:hypothetical protein